MTNRKGNGIPRWFGKAVWVVLLLVVLVLAILFGLRYRSRLSLDGELPGLEQNR